MVDGGDSIYAKVSAVNFFGESQLSEEGNGAYYTRVPDAPINLVEDVRYVNEISINWNPGTNDGGLAILDYRITLKEQGAESFTSVLTGIT